MLGSVIVGERGTVELSEEVMSEARRRKWSVETRAGIGGKGVRDVLRKAVR